MVEESTQRCFLVHRCPRRWLIRILKPQRNDIAQALMGSLPVVMMLNLPEYVAKMLLSEQDQIVQRLSSLSHEPLGIRIAHQ
jgi:hypothetical protein